MKELLVCVWMVFEYVLQLRVKPSNARRAVTPPEWHMHAPITVRIDLDCKLRVAVNSGLVNTPRGSVERGRGWVWAPRARQGHCELQTPGGCHANTLPADGCSSQGADLQNGNHSQGDSTLKAARGWRLCILEAASPLWMIPTIHLWLLDLDYFC